MKARQSDHRTRKISSIVRVVPILTLVLMAAGCGELLEVELPGEVTEENINDPALAQTLANSVVAQVECSWNNYVAAASHHSDEWVQASGNSTMKRWGLRRINETFASYAEGRCEEAYGLFTPLHIARDMANDNFERIQGFPDDSVEGKIELLAQIRAYGGWPLIAFAEGMCGTPLDGGDQVFRSEALFQRATDKFTEAISLAEQAGRQDLKYMSLVGRARAQLGLGNYDQVVADAEQVPRGFRFVATRDRQPDIRQNRLFEAINATKNMDSGFKHATITPSYRDVEWKDVDDPRVPVVNTGTLTFDGVTIHWRTTKVNSFSTDVRMASWEEAQMFIAEAEAFTGNLQRARDILNMFHDRAGIPSVTESDTPNQEAVIRHVLEERRREFFVEGGHRLHDMLRFRGTEFEIPFLGEGGSDFPNGVDQTGAPFGDATCFPVPLVEKQGV